VDETKVDEIKVDETKIKRGYLSGVSSAICA